MFIFPFLSKESVESAAFELPLCAMGPLYNHWHEIFWVLPFLTIMVSCSCKGECKRSFHPTLEDGTKSFCKTLGYTSREVEVDFQSIYDYCCTFIVSTSFLKLVIMAFMHINRKYLSLFARTANISNTSVSNVDSLILRMRQIQR